MPDDDILTRDLSSGKIHKRTADGRTHEADNLDDAGEYEVITYEQMQESDADALCDRCFGPDAK